MKYIARQISSPIKMAASQFPVISLIGPRQSGKTTLARNIFPDKPYYNLEAPDDRQAIIDDPRGFLAENPLGAIIDEVQNFPELLSYIQVVVDENQVNGQFIITGSHQLLLSESVSQSLAGRVAVFTLLPFSLKEISAQIKNHSIDTILFNGFYPRLYQQNINPSLLYRNYLQTYIERDVRLLINLKDLNTFQKFLKLCAGRLGQILNINSLANEVGVSNTTIKHWLSILEASFVIVLLQPYYENFGKRIIKSSKLYFTDVGLATYLLDITQETQVKRDPLRGNLFENLIVMELIKYRLNLGQEPNLYYFRDSNANEVDLIYKVGNKLLPIEIKSSATYNKNFLKGVKYFLNLVPDKTKEGVLIYSGDKEFTSFDIKIINYLSAYKILLD